MTKSIWSKYTVGFLHSYPFRSGLEESVAEDLLENGVNFEYEGFSIPYMKPQKKARYTPDFLLPNGIIIETKGRFLTADRQKLKLVREQHPDLDIRLVFSNSKTKLSKKSKTTYAMWAERNGFKYEDYRVPKTWIEERPEKARYDALNKLREGDKDGNTAGG